MGGWVSEWRWGGEVLPSQPSTAFTVNGKGRSESKQAVSWEELPSKGQRPAQCSAQGCGGENLDTETADHQLRASSQWLSSSGKKGRTMYNLWKDCCCSVAKSYPTLCDPINSSTTGSSGPHYLSPGVCPSLCALSQWCHPTVLSSVATFSSCPQSFPPSGSFQMSQLFTSGGQRIGASVSGSTLSMNIQGWLSLGLTGLIS